MYKDIEISDKLREGVKIDAPFPRNMHLAHKVLEKEGYNEKHDFIHIINQYENQFTKVRYIKTVLFINPDTKEKHISRYFQIAVPDRYIPTKNFEKIPEGVVKSEEDIL